MRFFVPDGPEDEEDGGGGGGGGGGNRDGLELAPLLGSLTGDYRSSLLGGSSAEHRGSLGGGSLGDYGGGGPGRGRRWAGSDYPPAQAGPARRGDALV